MWHNGQNSRNLTWSHSEELKLVGESNFPGEEDGLFASQHKYATYWPATYRISNGRLGLGVKRMGRAQYYDFMK